MEKNWQDFNALVAKFGGYSHYGVADGENVLYVHFMDGQHEYAADVFFPTIESALKAARALYKTFDVRYIKVCYKQSEYEEKWYLFWNIHCCIQKPKRLPAKSFYKGGKWVQFFD